MWKYKINKMKFLMEIVKNRSTMELLYNNIYNTKMNLIYLLQNLINN